MVQSASVAKADGTYAYLENGVTIGTQPLPPDTVPSTYACLGTTLTQKTELADTQMARQ